MGKKTKQIVLGSQIQNFKAIRNQAINYYTDPLKGEGGAIVGNRTIPESFNADNYFIKTVTSYLNSDSSEFNANIDKTFEAVGLECSRKHATNNSS